MMNTSELKTFRTGDIVVIGEDTKHPYSLTGSTAVVENTNHCLVRVRITDGKYMGKSMSLSVLSLREKATN